MDNTVGSRQRDIIIGTLLGDGFLERNGRYVRLIIDHSTKQEIYLNWKYQFLKELGGQVFYKHQFDKRTNKFYHHCVFRSRTSPNLESYYTLFYQNGVKRVPVALPKIISPQILAIWFMDDGYRRNDCNAARLNTQSYSANEHAIISQALITLGIESSIHKQKQNLVTYIPSHSMNRLRQLLKGLIIPEMEYKIV